NEENEENNNEENEVENNEDTNDSAAKESDFDAVLAEVEDITDGETNVLYEETEAQVHEEDAYSVSLDNYVVAELTDVHMDYSIPLGDSDEGAILVTHHTIENKSDDDIAYTPNWSLKYSGADRFPGINSDMLPDDMQLRSLLTSDNNYVIPAGESVSGYSILALRTIDIENIDEVGFAQLETPAAGDEYVADDYEYKNKLGKQVEMEIHVSGDGSEASADADEFYVDRTTTENMGTKTMVKEKSDINETKTLGKSEITLDGYQFTEFEPN